ncbi:MAG: hypothetical protein ACOZJX_12415 [Pseudomonadota bacterium]
MGWTQRAARAAWASSCLAAGLLAGCGGGVTSEITSATLSPSTISAPPAGSFTAFDVDVRVKSRSSAVLRVYVMAQRPGGSQWDMIGSATCAPDQDCEGRPVSLDCYSSPAPGNSGQRQVDCSGAEAPLVRGTGALKLRLELREYSVLSGPSVFLEDSAEIEGTLQ